MIDSKPWFAVIIVALASGWQMAESLDRVLEEKISEIVVVEGEQDDMQDSRTCTTA